MFLLSNKSMKRLKYSLLFIIPILIILYGCINSSFFRMLRYGDSDTDDFKKFATRKISSKPSNNNNLRSDKTYLPDEKLEKVLTASETYAFIIIKDDSIKCEQYFNNHTDSSLSLYFSITKSVMALLVGCAIDDSLIHNENDFVCDYLPELRGNGFVTIKIMDLLQMTAPINYTENDNPFGKHAQFYYSDDLEKEVLKLKTDNGSQNKFEYKSCNTELLGIILKRQLKKESLSHYLERKIWRVLEMETDAEWIIDKPEGIEKTWCCLAGTAKDFARIVKLYIDKGKFKEKQIVSEKWVEKTLAPLDQKDSGPVYSYGWWLYPKDGYFAAIGKDGQFALAWPSKKTIIVRLGAGMGNMDKEEWLKLLSETVENIDK